MVEASATSARLSLADLFHSARHKQSICILAILVWVAECDGGISARQQALLGKLAEADEEAGELGTVQAAMRAAQPHDLEVVCRYLKHNLDRGGKKLLAQLAVTMAIQDGHLGVSENLVLQFLADLLGLSPRTFASLFEQIAHRPFPRAGDPGTIDWWQGRKASQPVRPTEWARINAGDDTDPRGPEQPMTRDVAMTVLGLETGAPREAIHRAYRRLAKTRHPDRFTPLGPAAVATATEAFKRLHEAYTILSA